MHRLSCRSGLYAPTQVLLRTLSQPQPGRPLLSLRRTSVAHRTHASVVLHAHVLSVAVLLGVLHTGVPRQDEPLCGSVAASWLVTEENSLPTAPITGEDAADASAAVLLDEASGLLRRQLGPGYRRVPTRTRCTWSTRPTGLPRRLVSTASVGSTTRAGAGSSRGGGRGTPRRSVVSGRWRG